ncbi:3-demethylubiquinone-9 3-methyltransferase protein [Marine Group I thaumarchaeote SCGC AAA799-P11]|uniref:3-demethylubiquinone-9 3-methyltransferase protein n=1 Tax=Marine Group I thaumarchaeote SCGC AAA799-P11 TaxID=1502295 RepID=A0A087S320_9ARCH|nr:3-demethylubiquinone-9 3-methyltransferase protein [Marine Group I thaumarchaeote SCGC AAA799-P11]
MKCRFCGNSELQVFLDLGMSPLANSFLKQSDLNNAESFYPLCSYFCQNCFLVQLDEFEPPKNIFSNYVYFSSFSDTWNSHIESFVSSLISKFNISKERQVIEIASNDGYLLKHFKKHEFPVLGIEPAANIAKVAESNGIPTVNKFFGIETANELSSKGRKADVLIAFNVLPHVPNLTEFVQGLKILLNQKGLLVVQFSAYLMSLIKYTEFDMIYHEHFSYFSLHTLEKIFSKNDLSIFDVEKLPVHGGSLRLFISHKDDSTFTKTENVSKFLEQEKEFGLQEPLFYKEFSKKVLSVKQEIWKFFISSKNENKKIVCYGAPAKGNTLLNFCGIGKDFIDYTVDKNDHKQNLFLPGTHIPIFSPEKVKSTKPDYLLILPWNLKDEIIEQMSFIREWNGKFVVLLPRIEIID